MEDIKRVENMNYFELPAWLGIGSCHLWPFHQQLKDVLVFESGTSQLLR